MFNSHSNSWKFFWMARLYTSAIAFYSLPLFLSIPSYQFDKHVRRASNDLLGLAKETLISGCTTTPTDEMSDNALARCFNPDNKILEREILSNGSVNYKVLEDLSSSHASLYIALGAWAILSLLAAWELYLTSKVEKRERYRIGYTLVSRNKERASF